MIPCLHLQVGEVNWINSRLNGTGGKPYKQSYKVAVGGYIYSWVSWYSHHSQNHVLVVLLGYHMIFPSDNEKKR